MRILNKFPLESTFKMRAECIYDAGRALTKLASKQGGVLNMTISEMVHDNVRYPDVLIEFTSALSLETIQKLLSKITDGHVMTETVQLAEVYTGKRVDLREESIHA